MEYCAGGSVASLMRPAGGLPERWIIPILREVAEAVYWVHKYGIIHRDIKCANILVTEAGGVQLGDFGVAGIIQTKSDKRNTVTGTLQWMAPELFDSTVSYGTEVDIWAFGSMAYEVTSGLPPNATTRIDLPQFGAYLKQNCPRLQGNRYSSPLKGLVAYCMVEDPAQRPPIEDVQKHPYIFNTHDEYQTVSLRELVHAYKLWEAQGGARQSLFSAGGAQGRPASTGSSPVEDEWDFDTHKSQVARISFGNATDAQVVFGAYGPGPGVLPGQSPGLQGRRRRRPPQMKEFKGPLERVFDPNTMSNYKDNLCAAFFRPNTPPASDLPLRQNSEQLPPRESLIDLDLSLEGGELATFVGLETIKPCSFSGEPSGWNDYRRTQDWSFPVFAPADAEPDDDLELREPNNVDTAAPSSRATTGWDGHRRTQDWTFATAILSSPTHPAPASVHSDILHPGEGRDSNRSPVGPSYRTSAMSLIDLDVTIPVIDRPSSADSDAPSTRSDIGTGPFYLESSANVRNLDHFALPMSASPSGSERPSIFVTVDEAAAATAALGASVEKPISSLQLHLQELPPPSKSVMGGTASPDEVKDEFRRLVSSLREHLQACGDTVTNQPV